ncbi:hypothetical protein B1218_34425, partial [Pseudomonas ogarae]
MPERGGGGRLGVSKQAQRRTAGCGGAEARAADRLGGEGEVDELAEVQVLDEQARRGVPVGGGRLVPALLADLAEGTQGAGLQ